MELSADVSSPARARALVQGALEDRACAPNVVDEAVLLVSELVTNVVLHARTPMRVNVQVTEDEIRVEVEDGSDTLPRASSPDRYAQHGHGLQLVARVARSWGVDRRKEGKVVWFELAA